MTGSKIRKDRYSIYAGPPLARLVEERADESCPPTKVVNVAAGRYLAVLDRNMPNLATAEWMLVFDALNGTIHDDAADSVEVVWTRIEDRIQQDGLAEKWKIDGDALVSKLKALRYAEAAALVDAAERFWRRFGGGTTTAEEALAALGIRPAPPP